MKDDMNYGEDFKSVPATSKNSGKGIEVTPDLYCYTDQMVNVTFVGKVRTSGFVIVDTGMPNSAEKLIAAAEERFGQDSRPTAIVLTHAHFDHVGSVIDLVRHWDVPVFIHPLEMPYVTGEKSYPKPDATVEGGLVAKISPYFPTDPINLGDHVQELPADGTVPPLPGFRWVHVPGHTPGQVALFRDMDKALIAGDAFVNVKQENLYKVITQKSEISGPPRYLTSDWDAARQSVQKLNDLHPEFAITGHGLPLIGKQLTDNLGRLARDFDEIAVPDHGKYQ